MKFDKNKLILAMAKSEMLQKDLAEAAQIATSTMCHIYNGGTCSPAMAGKIARILKVDVENILDSN